MISVDLPPQDQERVVCSIVVSVTYEVPANIVLAVAEQEEGRLGQWVKNTNGTYDVGPLQFNTAYLKELKSYGITAADIEHAGCYPYELAAWRLRSHILHDRGDLWTRVANYNSRTPTHNARYRVSVMRKAAKWAEWLSARFHTVRFLDHLNKP